MSISHQYIDKSARDLRQEEAELTHIFTRGRLMRSDIPVMVPRDVIARRLSDVRKVLRLRVVR